MAFLEPGISFIESFIASIGYPGVAALMALDATIIPVPSAVVMGFAGYSCYLGHMDIVLVTLVGALGSMFGSLTMFLLALWGGRPLLKKYGRYIGLKKDSLSKAEAWFDRYGHRAVVVCQLFPIARDLIAFPAGAARMSTAQFAFYSFLGSIPFCLLLALAGMLSGPAWRPIVQALDDYDVILAVLFLLLVAIYAVYRRSNKRIVPEE